MEYEIKFTAEHPESHEVREVYVRGHWQAERKYLELKSTGFRIPNRIQVREFRSKGLARRVAENIGLAKDLRPWQETSIDDLLAHCASRLI